jgi:hypothetical protein
MGLAYIGSFDVSPHYDPSFSWASSSDAKGFRDASISGRIDWAKGKGLSELVASYERRVTFGDRVGVLEVVWFDDELLRAMNGWYLLSGLDLPPGQVDSLIDIVPFSLSATHVPPRYAPLLAYSARARSTDFSLTAQSLVVQPFWGEPDSGEPFAVDPGGVTFQREYDDRTQYDAASLSNDPRYLRIQAGTAS